MECLNLHQNLFEVFEEQIKNYREFEKTFKDKERKIFGINGKEAYRKNM